MSSSRLAVVIPVYNHAHYIVRGLRSVLDQTRPVDRIIVIDDGSKDDSVEVIRAMNEPRIELHTQENQNAFNTINRAIKMAAEDCDYISILNSDDYYHLDRFEKLLPLLEANPDKQVICSAIQVIDEHSEDLADDHERMKWFNAVWSVVNDKSVDTVEWMGLANFPATTSNVIGRAKYMAANPFRPYHFNHDYYFLTGAAWRDAIMVHNERLVYYRVHATNTITSAPAPLMRELLRQHLDLLKDFRGELQADVAMRRRMKLYFRAAFDSVSSLHMGLLMMLFSDVLQDVSHDEILGLVNELDEENWDELRVFPNRHIVNNHERGGPLAGCTQLAEKLDMAQTKIDRLRADKEAAVEHRRLVSAVNDSRWIALGRALGGCKNLAGDRGKNVADKCDVLRDAIAHSGWVKFGRSLGACRRLNALD